MPIALKRRQDTRANWESNDPVVIERQLAFTEGAGEFGTPLFKIGDGTTAWSNLPYINRKNNLTATTDPTTANDDSQNYSVGSLWSNVNSTSAPKVFILTDLSSGAEWVRINDGTAQDLADTLLNGNITDGTDIDVSEGDAINFLNNTFEFAVSPTTLNANRTETKPNADIDWTAAAPQDNYVMTYDHSAATWSAEASGGGGGGGEDLGETLYNGNTTDGEDIVFSNGDVADFTNAGNATNIITLPNSGFIQHVISGGLSWRTPAGLVFSTASGELFRINTNGSIKAGDNSISGSLILGDGSSANTFTIDNVTPLTSSRTETKPDGDIDWTAGASEDDYVMTYDHSTETWSAEAASGGITESDVINTSRQYVAGQGLTNFALSTTSGIVDIDLDDGNSFTLDMDEDTELQLPYADRPQAIQIRVLNNGGHTLTFETGYRVFGDTPTDTDGDDILLNIACFGDDEPWVFVTNEGSTAGDTPNLSAVTNEGNTTADDIEITDSSSGVILTSPDSTRWRVTIDNSGNLVTTSL